MTGDNPPRKSGCAISSIAALLFFLSVVLALLGRAGCGPCAYTPNYFARHPMGRVVDEKDQPVGDASVAWSWSEFELPPKGGRVHEGTVISASDGQFSIARVGALVFFQVAKPGHYKTHAHFDPKKLPSGDFVIQLRRIHHPQAMIGKKVKLNIPVGASRLEYDFIAGDCLPPLGQGTYGDLVIKWTRPNPVGAEASRRAFSSRVSGEGNGVIAETEQSDPAKGVSKLRSSYEAPVDGYQPDCDFGNHFRGGMLVAYLKIRSGQPGGPLYGKMLDPISYWAGREEDEFTFEYVINPSGNRGLEMDMNKLTVPSRLKFEHAPEEF